MKIALAQINCLVGDFDGNCQTILSYLERARRDGADLVVFPELSVCGYPALDFLAYDDFVEKCQATVEKIAQACVGISAIIGAPVRNPAARGKKLLNTAVLLSDGKQQQMVAKSLLPDYDVFDEYRHFEPANRFQCIRVNGKKIALTICEDLWVEDSEQLYAANPMDQLVLEKPDLMINIAASPFSEEQQTRRKNVLHQNCKRYKLPLIYVNQVGAQTDLIFDGGSLAMNSQGNVVVELAYFQQDYRLVDSGRIEFAPSVPFEHELFPNEEANLEQIRKALTLGIRDFFFKSGFQKAVLGLSGGIDSALVYALAVEALGTENVLGILMPSPYSSEHSVEDALTLAQNLGARTEVVPIHAPFESFLNALSEPFKGLPANITEENIQARIRAIILMAYSNKKGYILLNTSNKSEAAVGYGTLYGDMAGSLAVIADVYKTKVYALARCLNADREIIPENILTKEPSAELREGQKDSDSLPPYEILDQILFQYIEQEQSPEAILAMGFDKSLVSRIVSLVNRNEFKRYQSAPILRVSKKSFGSGRRMPLVAKYRIG